MFYGTDHAPQLRLTSLWKFIWEAFVAISALLPGSGVQAMKLRKALNPWPYFQQPADRPTLPRRSGENAKRHPIV
ncbi:hypothetical protein AKJ16_DCAP09814 [Drosera capensis]